MDEILMLEEEELENLLTVEEVLGSTLFNVGANEDNKERSQKELEEISDAINFRQ